MTSRTLRAAAGVAVLLLSAAGASASRAPDWVLRARGTTVQSELLAGPPAPDAVVLWRQQIITAGSISGASKVFERRAVKVLTPGGASALVFHSTYDDDSTVDVEGAWTLHADGNAETLDLREVLSVQVGSAEYFTDTHVMAFRPPRLAPNDIAAYALSRKSRKDVYQWTLPVQGSYPIAAQEVAIDLPEGWTHRWRLTGKPDGYGGAMTGEGGAKASYPFPSQRGIQEEEHSGSFRDREIGLQVVALPPSGKFPELVFQNWGDVGRWFHRKSLPARKPLPDGAVPAFPSDTMRSASRWVQDRIRYAAIEVGEGGYVPREPSLVVKRLYGDCKDKAFLLMAILARAGVEAVPVLTRGRDDGRIDPEFPSPVQFNHLIVAIKTTTPTGLPAEVRLPGGAVAVIFDPTDAWTPFGHLPAHLQGARGLVARADGGDLIELPYSAPAQNRLTRGVEAEITEDGSLEAQVTESTEGALSERDLYQRQTAEERTRMIDRYVEGSIRGSRAAKLELVNLDDRDKPLDARFHVSAGNYMRRTGSLLLLPVLPFPVGPVRLASQNARRFPIDLGCPKKRELVVRIKPPAGTRVDELPEKIVVENQYGRYSFTAGLEGEKLVVRETYEIHAPEIPLTDLAAWKAIESAAVKAQATKVVLVRKG
jgi:hypothetical protein